MLVKRMLPQPFSLHRLCFSHSFKQPLWEIIMKTRIALFALALAALPFAAQSASAQGFWGRDEARIVRDNARIWHERAISLATGAAVEGAARALCLPERQAPSWQCRRGALFRLAQGIASRPRSTPSAATSPATATISPTIGSTVTFDIAHRDHDAWHYR